MRILVTGGAGFIGSNFVRMALASRNNLEITVLDSLTYAGRLANLNGLMNRITFCEGSICDPGLVEKLVANSDVVVHFAAESHNDNSLKDPSPFIDTNIKGTFNIIQYCAKFGVRFHHVSTDEVFGDLPLGTLDKFNRDSPYNPSSPYSASKAASDQIVKAWVRSFGLQATVSNCGNNFGPYQHEEKLIPRTILSVLAGIKPKIYGTGLNVRDWIHVDDHNEGIWAILERGQIGQTYLLGANGERTNLQVVGAILEAMGRPADFFEFVEDRPGHDLRYAIDASETFEELGWQPGNCSLNESLKSVIDHYANRVESGEIELDKNL